MEVGISSSKVDTFTQLERLRALNGLELERLRALNGLADLFLWHPYFLGISHIFGEKDTRNL